MAISQARYLGQDKDTGEYIYRTPTGQVARTATEPGKMTSMDLDLLDEPPIEPLPGTSVERLSPEQLAGTPEQRANIARLREQVAYKPTGGFPDFRLTDDELAGLVDRADEYSGPRTYKEDTPPDATNPDLGQEEPTQKPAGPKTPGMGSVKGRLAALEKEIDREHGFQENKYKLERAAHLKRLKDADDESQVAAARSRMKVAEDAMNTATEKLKNWEIDPKRAFPNAFSKIAAVIGVAMGAYAQGLSGGKLPNTALDIVNGAIDRDIDAQKAEYAKLKGLVDEKRNVYGMAMRMLGNEQQATSLAKSLAFKTTNANMMSMGKQFGLTNDQLQKKLGIIGIAQRENAERAKLIARAAKDSVKTSKLPKEMTKAVSSFGATSRVMADLWNKVGQFEYGPLSGAWQQLEPGEDPADEFNRKSEQALLEMVHAISGVAVRPDEYDRIKEFFPNATSLESTNRAKIIGAVEYAVNKGAGHYATLPPEQKAAMIQAVPELVGMYTEKDPTRREALITSFLKQQSGEEFFGSETRVRGQ